MKLTNMIQMTGVHCEGEIGKVVTGGVMNIPGKSILEKMNYINNVDSSIQKFLFDEPRGKSQMSVNLIFPPCDSKCDAGFVVLQPDMAHALSGSNTMCITTCLLETGIVKMEEPLTKVKFDTAVGMIQVDAKCENGKVKSSTVEMCESFCEVLDVEIDVESLGKLKLDIGFGGCYFALCDINQLGLKIEPEYAQKLVDLGDVIKKEIDKQISVQHPEIKDLNQVEYIMFTDEVYDRGDKIYKNATIIYPGRVDRSPCGTGSSARMAVLMAKGLVDEGDEYFTESIIGGRFKNEVYKKGFLEDGRSYVIPKLTGRAWIYSMETVGMDPEDAIEGYRMADTWGPQV